MTFSFLGPDPVERQVEQVLERLATGEAPSRIECTQVDVKEEPDRRGPSGDVREGARQNDKAAKYLAGEMACLANTPGGGAIILGVADDGRRIGTDLNADWLRHRLWEFTDRKLTVTIREVLLDDKRLLVLTTHEAIEPIRVAGKLTWRVDARCVEVDATTWHAGRLQHGRVDWSALPSGHTAKDVTAAAVTIARRYLEAAGDDAALDLAAATDEDLIRRLHLVRGDGRLTNAGSLLLVGTPDTGIDYIRRETPGGDSTLRVRSARPLLEQVWEVDQASWASNRTVHVPDGFAHGQRRAIPSRAVREAIVNGVTHRDWLSPLPTTVEHTGDTLTVTSPGGFIGGIGPTNIITHPAVARYQSLAEAMASLRLAEREGVGVDRMVRDMLASGHPEPDISEIPGPYVRVVLVGGDPEVEVLGLLTHLEPTTTRSDVDALLLIDHLSRRGWVDVAVAGPLLQRSEVEASAATDRLARAVVDGQPAILPVNGTPPGEPGAYRLGDTAKMRLTERLGRLDTPAGRAEVLMNWARHRGRVSSTEAADLTGLSQAHVRTVLDSLEADGLLVPGRANKRGRGFFYAPA